MRRRSPGSSDAGSVSGRSTRKVRPPQAAGAAQDYRPVVVAASVGTFVELYDLVVYGYFATILAGQFFPDRDPTAGLLATLAIFAVGFVVRPVGAILFGHVGDRVGRRHAVALSLLLMTLATVALGLLPTYATVGLLAPVLLLLCRTLQGLAASAEVPGAHLLILEHAPHHLRGRAVAVNNAAGHLASAAAATAGLVLSRLLPPEQLASWGWRLAFLVAVPIGLVGVYVRTRLWDSPAFLALGESTRQGRAPLARAVGTATRGMVVVGIWMAVTSLGVYLVIGFLPGHLTRSVGLSAPDAFAANLVAVLTLAASALFGGYLVDRFSVRRVAVGAMTGIAVTAVPGMLLITEGRTLMTALLGQSMWTVFLGAAYTAGTVLAVTMFPVAVRFTANALALNVGITLLGSTAPYVSTWLVVTTDTPLAVGGYLLVAAVCGLLTAVLGIPGPDPTNSGPPARSPRTAGRAQSGARRSRVREGGSPNVSAYTAANRPRWVKPQRYATSATPAALSRFRSSCARASRTLRRYAIGETPRWVRKPYCRVRTRTPAMSARLAAV